MNKSVVEPSSATPAADEGGKPLSVQPSGRRKVTPGLGPLPAPDADTGTANDQIEPIVLFEFASEQDWVNRARSLFSKARRSSETAICIDAKGRDCFTGKDFRRATKDGAYPVKVYAKGSEEGRS